MRPPDNLPNLSRYTVFPGWPVIRLWYLCADQTIVQRVTHARAGEHGKGFAVVADEVRNLAQRCAQAAKETTGLIEDAVHRSQQGTQVAGEVGKALTAIVGDAARVSELINGIARASAEQAQGVDQVNTAVAQMDNVTQANASAAEELAAQAQAVKGMVGELMGMIAGTRSAALAENRKP